MIGGAESRVRTWRSVVRPQTVPCTPSSKLSITARSAVGSRNETFRDQLQGRIWVLLTLFLYGLPINACVGCFLLSRSFFLRAIQWWLFSEAAFLVYRFFEYRRVSDLLIHNPVPELEEVKDLLERILSLRDDVDPTAFLSGWFLGAPCDKIRRGNMREFLAYTLYHRSFGDSSPTYAQAVEEHIIQAEHAWGSNFAEGYNPEVKFMAHTREPLRIMHHPLALYVWARMVSSLTGIVLRCRGFRRWQSSQPALCYWYRPAMTQDLKGQTEPEMKKVQKLARVFVHGLGIGITPYLGFINMLLENHEGATVIVELGHIALQLQRRVPTADDLASALEDIHERHSIGAAQYIGHSYGSMMIARLVRRNPKLVASLALVDPVCFLLCLPDVVYNFIYRAPSGETPFRMACDLARWFFCSKEMQVAQVLCRGFDWHMLHLWVDQIPTRHTAVMLSGKDSIVPAPQVKTYLEKNGVHVLYNEEFQHGEYLFKPDAQRALLQALDRAAVRP